jgi:hypothetical protein
VRETDRSFFPGTNGVGDGRYYPNMDRLRHDLKGCRSQSPTDWRSVGLCLVVPWSLRVGEAAGKVVDSGGRPMPRWPCEVAGGSFVSTLHVLHEFLCWTGLPHGGHLAGRCIAVQR